MNKLDQAMEDHKKGNWDAADKIYEEILLEEPDNAEVLYLLAISKNSQNQLDEAEEIIEKAIKINSNAPAYMQTKGMILARKGKSEEAIEVLSSALNENPNLYQSHITIGHLYYQKGSKTEAEKHFKMAIKVDEKQVEGHLNLAKVLIDQGDAQEAINLLSEIEKEHPEQTSIKMMMGQGFIERGAHSFAESYFQKVLAMNPEYDLAGLYLGVAKIDTGDMENAEKLIAAFNKEHPNTKEGVAALGILMFKKNNFRVAANYLYNAIGEGIVPMSWRVALVESMAKLGQIDSAIMLYEEEGENIKYKDTNFRLAELYELKGKTKKAKKQYKKTKKEDSKYIASLLGLSRCYLVEEKAKKAEKTTDKILERNEGHAEGLLLKLTSLLFQDKKEKALKILKSIDYEKYSDVYKKTFRLQHGLILDKQAKYEKALKVFMDRNKKEGSNVVKVNLLNEKETQAIQQFEQQCDDERSDPVFIIGAQSTAINEFSYWLHQQGVPVLNDRLISKGRPDILYAEREIDVLTNADQEMVKTERALYHEKAKTMLGAELTTFADCMYINPKQVAIIRKFFPKAKVLLLTRDTQDISFNQRVYGEEPINAKDWQAVKEQVFSMGLDMFEIDIDNWFTNKEETLKIVGHVFNKNLSYKEKQTTKYWRKKYFKKDHWKNYKQFLEK